MISPYIPYSKRHEIEDPDLAGLLDYIERVMGWDIVFFEGMDDLIYAYDFGKNKTLNLWHDDEIQFLYSGLDLRMPKDIFFRSYKTLLPVIRDLYRNK